MSETVRFGALLHVEFLLSSGFLSVLQMSQTVRFSALLHVEFL